MCSWKVIIRYYLYIEVILPRHVLTAKGIVLSLELQKAQAKTSQEPRIPMSRFQCWWYWVNSIFLPQHFTFLGEMLHNELCRNLNNYPQNLGTSVPTQATFRPRAHDEDLQRELAAMHRCDAICAISQEEEQLVKDYGIPSWKAPIEREKQMNLNSTWKKQQWHLVNFIHLLVLKSGIIHWTLVWVSFFKPTQLDVVQIQGRLNTSSGALDLWIHQVF